MARPCQRARLEDGIKLDLNRLARRGFIQPGAATGPIGIGINWIDGHTGEITASAIITADMSGQNEGWFRIQSLKADGLDQWIGLVTRPRHFGGRQWYFICPRMGHRAMVLWMPPGAHSFACRKWWGRQVAYSSQFLGPDDRAHHGQAKIKSRLCSIGRFDPNEWDLPPKPKWMRWRTYNRAVEKFDWYESILDKGTFELLARLSKKKSK
jgi:hypothetical protein